MFDDSGDSKVRYELSLNYPDFEVIPIADVNVGLNFAYNIAFKHLKEMSADFTLWIEEDQKLLSKLSIESFVDILKNNKVLQVSTNRLSFFDAELGSSSVVKYLIQDGWPMVQKKNFITHTSMWANHPNIFNNIILDIEYPADMDTLTSELRFGKELLKRFPRHTFAFYGNIDDEPQSEHFGKISKNTINYYWGKDE